MSIFGIKFVDYARNIWPFMAVNCVLGIIELLLFRLEFLTLNNINLFYLPGMTLLVVMGVVLNKRGFKKRQAAAAGLICLLSVVWLPPFIMQSLNIPLGYQLINLGIMYAVNAILYVALTLIGWLVSSLISRRRKLRELANAAEKKSMVGKAKVRIKGKPRKRR